MCGDGDCVRSEWVGGGQRCEVMCIGGTYPLPVLHFRNTNTWRGTDQSVKMKSKMKVAK